MFLNVPSSDFRRLSDSLARAVGGCLELGMLRTVAMGRVARGAGSSNPIRGLIESSLIQRGRVSFFVRKRVNITPVMHSELQVPRLRGRLRKLVFIFLR